MKVEGLENIPEAGGFILCCNHMSMVDPVYLAVSIRNRRVRFMAKAEVFSTKILGPIARGVGAFPVDRGHSDLNAVRTSLKILSEGHPLGIFPQGTRSKGNVRTPMLGGVSMIAMRAGVPVIPAYIHGPYKLLRKSYIRIGKPVDLAPFGRRFDADTMGKVTQAIDDAVWSMAPSADA
jgi:1-acyl-sn-glycerol-3-phosphate acyltransferase